MKTEDRFNVQVKKWFSRNIFGFIEINCWAVLKIDLKLTCMVFLKNPTNSRHSMIYALDDFALMYPYIYSLVKHQYLNNYVKKVHLKEHYIETF